jgi:hypothetical protein
MNFSIADLNTCNFVYETSIGNLRRKLMVPFGERAQLMIRNPARLPLEIVDTSFVAPRTTVVVYKSMSLTTHAWLPVEIVSVNGLLKAILGTCDASGQGLSPLCASRDAAFV